MQIISASGQFYSLAIAPGAPTLDSVTPGDTTNTVAWTPPAGSPDSYNLYWSTSTPVTTGSTKITGATSPYVHTGRTNGTEYFYAVTAVKGGLESALSNEVSGTPRLAAFSVQTTASPQDFSFYTGGPLSSLVVNWGDGNEDTFGGGNSVRTHSYATAGTYTVTFKSGTVTHISFGNGFGMGSVTPTLIKNVLTPFSAALGLTNANRMFQGCTGITSWAAGFFDAASANVTSTEYMFQGLSTFNESLSGWNTANVTTMADTFNSCSAFNQPLSGWNTAKVTAMNGMFFGCTNFNQDISGWNVTAVTTCNSMLTNSGFTQTNYDLLLNINTGWPSQNVQNSVQFHAGTAKYDNENADVANGRAHLATDHSWTITDGGPD